MKRHVDAGRCRETRGEGNERGISNEGDGRVSRKQYKRCNKITTANNTGGLGAPPSVSLYPLPLAFSAPLLHPPMPSFALRLIHLSFSFFRRTSEEPRSILFAVCTEHHHQLAFRVYREKMRERERGRENSWRERESFEISTLREARSIGKSISIGVGLAVENLEKKGAATPR